LRLCGELLLNLPLTRSAFLCALCAFVVRRVSVIAFTPKCLFSAISAAKLVLGFAFDAKRFPLRLPEIGKWEIENGKSALL
jgi:hypothetical protein